MIGQFPGSLREKIRPQTSGPAAQERRASRHFAMYARARPHATGILICTVTSENKLKSLRRNCRLWEQTADECGVGNAPDGENVGGRARVDTEFAHRFVHVVEG